MARQPTGLPMGRKVIHGHQIRSKTGNRKGSPEYRAWQSVKARCSPRNAMYRDNLVYVHPSWRESFEIFLNDMGVRPSARHQFLRKDKGKGFTPENCHWVERKKLAQRKQQLETEYTAWRNLKQKCLNPNYPSYEPGLTLHRAWADSYEAFLADVGRRPSPKHKFFQIVDCGDFVPGNVHWVLVESQKQKAVDQARVNRKLAIFHIAERLSISMHNAGQLMRRIAQTRDKVSKREVVLQVMAEMGL